jgi:hypothetical protein
MLSKLYLTLRLHLSKFRIEDLIMRKFLLLWTVVLFSCCLAAQSFDPNEWYYIQFAQSGLVVESQGANAQLKSVVITGKDAQLWRVRTVGEQVHIYSKEDTSLRVTYDCNGTYIMSMFTDFGNELTLTQVDPKTYALHRILYSKGSAAKQLNGFIVRNGNLSKTYAEDRETHIRLIKQSETSSSKSTLKVVKVYPNVTSDFIFIEAPDDVASISLISAVGQVVKYVKPKQTVEKIDISTFNAGVYFVRVEKGSDVKTFKVVVNK